MKKLNLTLCAALIMAGCSPAKPPQDSHADQHGFTAASDVTIDANKALYQQLPFDDKQDFIDADKGLIAVADDLVITKNGKRIWNNADFSFVKGDAPDSVNPSSWRQAVLNNKPGLYKVADKVYQLRGFDLANMSIIEGDSGWIIVDPLTSSESAKAALEFAREHLGTKPITAIIFTHAHMDHFGGALGIVTAKQVEQQNIQVIAPDGFMEAATSENIIAGVAMARRTMFQYGKNLPRTERGYVGSLLGKGPVFGTFGILEPNLVIKETGEQHVIDGVTLDFQLAPETESPAEFTFYMPEQKIFCGAELVSRNMHNLYTLRGAQVRNALKWSHHIDEAKQIFAEAEIYFASHHWPIWGNQQIHHFLEKQRDIYKFIHDQSVRLFNQGLTSEEVAESISLPEELANYFPIRGYHGSLKHNAKAVYQYYLGWYDANPANLDPLPLSKSAQKYVQLMGGSESILKVAQQSYDEGDYRWVAEILNKLVFAEPENNTAKSLLAKAYDQLGYQSEAGSWRNAYLTGSMELRQGTPEEGVDMHALKDLLIRTPVDKFFQSMAIRLNSEKAAGKEYRIRISFSDLQQSYLLVVKNAVLHFYLETNESSETDASLTLTHEIFINMLTGSAGIKDTLLSDQLSIQGSTLDLIQFFMLFDQPDGLFNIVTP